MKARTTSEVMLEQQLREIEEAFEEPECSEIAPAHIVTGPEDEVLEGEVVDEEKHENRSETSKSGSAHSTSRLPWLFPLTAEKLFEMARRQPDPAREMFGYFYEAELKKECQHLIEYPLYAGDFYNLLYCHKLLVANGQYFKCAAAIQPILQNYLNAMEEYENEGRV